MHEARRGYGSAYLAGFAAARGKYIVTADADQTYDFGDIPRFIAQLDDGADMVIGNRMNNIGDGAMPWMNRYIGNPMLSGMLNLLYRSGIRDAHCGMRALRRDKLPVLRLRSTGMEFASEMVVRAVKEGLTVVAVRHQLQPPRGGVEAVAVPRRVAAREAAAGQQPDRALPRPGRGDAGARAWSGWSCRCSRSRSSGGNGSCTR